MILPEGSPVYCPPGFMDIVDGAGNSIDGGWRREKSPVMSLHLYYILIATGLLILSENTM